MLEVAIERIAVPLARPTLGAPPSWDVALNYAGLFLHYFAATLAVVVLVTGALGVLADRERRGTRDAVAQVAVVIAALLAASPVVVARHELLIVAIASAFAVAVIALIVAGFGRERDLGVQLGMVAIGVPLLIHTVNVLGARYLWPDTAYDGKIVAIERAGVMGLCFAALISPYVFAPRPFSRAVTRPAPVVVAMGVAAIGALAARLWYPQMSKLATLALGVSLDQDQADPRLAIYLLALATLAWTLVSCLMASAEARRRIGGGIALVVLGGYAFEWPHHYLLPLLGLWTIGECARSVRDEELAGLPITSVAPAVQDGAWAAYIGAAKIALERSIGEVHTVTTRGEGGLTTTLIVGDRDGLPVRIRIERIEGSVIAVDVVVGREIDEVRGATWSLWAITSRTLGINPHGPPAAPQFKSGDDAFDARFRSRGSARAFQKLIDEPLRARVAASLDGWLAYWEREGLRYRVYPGRGAQLDHPLPLSDLAMGRPVTADRLAAVIELLVAIAERGVERQPAAPSSLDDLALPESVA
jgi:hypothetical protein